jgi:hypothetical protein
MLVLSCGGVIACLTCSVLNLYCGCFAQDIYTVNNIRKVDYKIKNSDTKIE